MPVYRGWNAKIYKDGTLLGYAQSVTFDIENNLEAYYEIGSRTPVDLVEGNQEVTGTIERLWVDTTLLSLVSGSTLTEFTIDVYVGTMKVKMEGCKTETGSIDVPQDGEIRGSYDFRAKSITVS